MIEKREEKKREREREKKRSAHTPAARNEQRVRPNSRALAWKHRAGGKYEL